MELPGHDGSDTSNVAGRDKRNYKQRPRAEAERRVACKECRQQKVRCYGAKESSSCARCVQRNLNCVVDIDFKRTSKRKRMNELEEEMERLRAKLRSTDGVAGGQTGTGPIRESVSPAPPTPATANANAVNVHGGAGYASESSGNIPSNPPVDARYGSVRQADVDNNDLPAAVFTPSVHFEFPTPTAAFASELPEIETYYSEPRTIDGFTLSSQTIEILYREYVTRYHPILPVVDVGRGPARTYELSPALFWTIMAVASRKVDDGQLLDRFSAIQKTCLSEIAVSPVIRFAIASNSGTASAEDSVAATPSNRKASPPTPAPRGFNLPSVYSVQAFLICTLWPPPTSSINADSAWNTSGIAVFTAIRAGLHCPGHQKDFERIFKSNHPNRAKMSEQLVTWLATNYIVQKVAGMFGYPSIANFGYNDALRNVGPMAPEKLPPCVRHASAIEAIACDIGNSLKTSTKDTGERSSLIRIFSRRLDRFEAEHGSELDAYGWFTFLTERVHLLCYYLFDEDSDEVSSKSANIDSRRLRGVAALYNSCLELLSHVARCNDHDPTFISYMAQVDVQTVWQVSAVVCRLWHSSYGDFLDKAAGLELYQRTVGIIAQASIFEHDVAFRAAEIMPQMWNVFGAVASKGSNHKIRTASPELRTRQAASVFFDCLWTMRELCDIRSHAPTVLTERTARTGSTVGSTASAPNTPGSNAASAPTLVSVKASPLLNGAQASPAALNASPRVPSQSLSGLQTPAMNAVAGASSTLGSLSGIDAPSPGTLAAYDSYVRSEPGPGAKNHGGHGLLNPVVPSAPNPPQPAVADAAGPAAVTPAAQTDAWDPNWDLNAAWRGVDMFIEDYGFGPGELPYVSPPE